MKCMGQASKSDGCLVYQDEIDRHFNNRISCLQVLDEKLDMHSICKFVVVFIIAHLGKEVDGLRIHSL